MGRETFGAGIQMATCRNAVAAAVLLLAGAAPAAGLLPRPAEPAARESAPVAAPRAPAPAPLPIRVEEVFRAAEELEAPLRSADAEARADPAVDEVDRRLAVAAAAIDRLRPELQPHRLGDASAREIERLRQAVSREDLELASAQALLERRSDVLAGATRDIQERVASWRATAEAARREQAPPVVLRRIEKSEDALHGVEARLRAERDRLLALQGRVSDLRADAGQFAVALGDADAALQRQLFEVESAPLWRAFFTPDRTGGLGAQLRRALREGGRDVVEFVTEEQGRIWIHVTIVLALGAALIALRRPVGALAADDAPLRRASHVLSRPWSAALLVSLPLTRGLYPAIPPTVRDLLFLSVVAPILRLLRELVPDRFRRPLGALALLTALDRISALAPPRTLLARLAVLIVTVVALAGFANGFRRGGWLRTLGAGAWATATRAAAAAAVALLVISVISNVVGNATLAERLTGATLGSAALAAALFGIQAVVEGALAGVLHLPALRNRQLVVRHRALLERRAASLLALGSLALWASRTAAYLGIAGVASGALGAVLDLRLHVGSLDVSLGNVVAFGVTLALALALSRFVRFVLDEGVFAEFALPRGVSAAISTTIQYVLIVLGFSWSVLASGMEMSRFSVLVGALGVGIGFGLQNVVNNFVSGLILLYERPVQVGDVVEVGPVSGEITRIGVRSSTVRTFAGAEVIVPNATLISAEVTNWTLSDRRRRIEVAVGVAYGTDPNRVIALLLAAVDGRARVLRDPAPVALFLRFGESAIEFALRFWTADFDTWQVLASDVLIEVHASLGQAGIEIPFPQRDLHVRSIDALATEALAAIGTDAAETGERSKRLG